MSTTTTTAAVGPAGNLAITQITKVTTTTTTTVTMHVPPAAIPAVLTQGAGEVTIASPGLAPVTLPSSSMAPVPAYPIMVPPVAAPGAAVVAGAGPDALAFNMSNNPATPGESTFGVLVDGVWVLTGLVLTSTTGQSFTFYNSFGAGPHTVTFQGEGTVELLDCNWNSVKWNDAAYETSGQESIYNGNHIQTVAWTPAAVVVPAPPVAAPALTIVAGATINGVIAAPATLAALLAATPTGATLALPAGTIAGTAVIPNACTVTGALDAGGNNLTTIDCTGIVPAYQKGVLVPLVPGSTIENLVLMGATLGAPGSGGTSGSYASGIRDNAPGIGATVVHVEIHSCDMGIQSEGGSWSVSLSCFHDNGMGDGFSHNEYYDAGAPGQVIIRSGNRSVAGPLCSHNLKSRALTIANTGNAYSNLGDANAAISASMVDLSDGNVATFNGDTFDLVAGSANIQLLGFAFEGPGASGGSVAMLACILQGIAGKIECNAAAGASAALTVTGTTAQALPTIDGWATVAGTIVLAEALQ